MSTQIIAQPPDPEVRKKTVRGMERVRGVLNAETTNPQDQVKILLNTLGLIIARSSLDNPEDVEKIIQGIPMYVNAYRGGSGDIS